MSCFAYDSPGSVGVSYLQPVLHSMSILHVVEGRGGVQMWQKPVLTADTRGWSAATRQKRRAETSWILRT